jgi:hypothetical protein
MRTIKALACAAALAAGLATAVAQSNVYSLNVVGYYNVTIAPHTGGGMVVIANQLNTTNNNIQLLFPAPTAGSQIFVYADNGGYSSSAFDDLAGAWDRNDIVLDPGKAVFFKDAAAGAGQTLTFVGEVLQGKLTTTLPNGNSMRGSMVPQQGRLTADLGVPGEAGDQVFLYRDNGFGTSDAFDDLAMDWANPGGLVVNVGEGFFYKKAVLSVSTQWIRNFTVQ